MRKQVKKQVILLVLVLLASLALSSAEDAPDPRLAAKDDVYDTAEGLFETGWMPENAGITVLDEGDGLWNIRAKDLDSNEILAYMQIDGDNEDLVIYYRKASYAMPSLNRISERMLPEEEVPETAVQWAEEVFRAFRGSFNKEFPINCMARMEDGCCLFSFGYVSAAEAVLVAAVPEDPDGIPELMAYTDMNFNWNVRYDGYISLGEACEAALAACREKYSDLPEDHIVMDDSGFFLYDTADYYQEEEEDLPEVLAEPLWVILIEDQRADPSLSCYDPFVTYYIYPVLVDPSDGKVIEIREPESFGNG